MQLVSLGLSQVEWRLWVSPTGIPAQGKASWGQEFTREGQTLQFGNGRASHQSGPSLFSQDFYVPHGKPIWVPSQTPQMSGSSRPKPPFENLLLPHKECWRNPLFPPGLPTVEGWALQLGEAPSLFGGSYQGSCLCCSSFRLLISTTRLNMSHCAAPAFSRPGRLVGKGCCNTGKCLPSTSAGDPAASAHLQPLCLPAAMSTRPLTLQ